MVWSAPTLLRRESRGRHAVSQVQGSLVHYLISLFVCPRVLDQIIPPGKIYDTRHICSLLYGIFGSS